LATKVSIFSIDPPKFQFLSIQALFPKMPSIVIGFSQKALNNDSSEIWLVIINLIIGLHEQRLCLIEISLPQREFGGKDQIPLAVVSVGLED
jgi:hypothetical protein